LILSPFFCYTYIYKNKGEKYMIGPFEGEYRFLSNFYEGKPVEYNGKEYMTAEHAFQAAKTFNKEEHDFVASADHPGEAKRRGRKVTLRFDWNEVRNNVMRKIVWNKFSRDEQLKYALLATGNEVLVEKNTWNDLYWGTDMDGKGENYLGKILMFVRAELKLLREKRLY
jgi:ribA/ribD-fused uncharacterized protein